MSDWLYSDVVKDHFTNPRNVMIDDESSFKADGIGETGNIKCGDKMLMLLKINNDIITDIRWKTYGCASAIASTSMLSELAKGMSIEDAYKIRPEDIVDQLGGLPSYKIHCSVLGDKALRAAIDDYLEKSGRAGTLKERELEICHCIGITDKDLEKAYLNGSRTWEDLQKATKIGTVCGQCKEKALEYIHGFDHIYNP